MAAFLSNTKYAELIGISKQGVGKAIGGKLIFKSKLGIDPEHPINVVYRQKIEKKRKHNTKISKVKTKQAAKKRGTAAPFDPNIEAIPATTTGYDIDDRKKLEETRLKRIQADKAALEYASSLEIVVDDKTIRRKIGTFVDFLLNDLIAVPDSISDILVSTVRAIEDDTQAIEAVSNLLKKTIRDIVVNGKAAARGVRAPRKGRKYIIKKVDR